MLFENAPLILYRFRQSKKKKKMEGAPFDKNGQLAVESYETMAQSVFGTTNYPTMAERRDEGQRSTLEA